MSDIDEIEKHVEKMKKSEEKEEKEEKESFPMLDVLEEQTDKTDTTRWSEDAEFDLLQVEQHPESYIEINIVKKSRVVDTFFIFADKPKFKYKEKSYNIKEDGIYLLPKKGFFVPTCFYYEDKSDPVGFKQMNKGITGKAMTLLYKNRLYQRLLKTDDPNYNIFVIILLLAQLVLFGIAMYFLLIHNPDAVVNGGVVNI